MKINSKILNTIMDPEINLDERLFLLFTSVTELAMLVAFIGDIAIGEHYIEIFVLGFSLVINLIWIISCLKWHRIKVKSVIISFYVVLFILPSVYFFGGGPNGGSIIWFSYIAIYVGLLLKGALRYFMLSLLFLTAILDFVLAWFYPEIIYNHSRGEYYVDTVISILAVGIFAFIMVLFQNKIYIQESERAKAESEKAERLIKVQNSFFANMSHEIRTPINTILGLNEMILREDISDEVAEDARNIQTAGKILLTLINDILDKSKLESGQMHIHNMNYNFGEKIKEVVSLLAPKAAEKGLGFEVEVAPDIPAGLVGDELRIRQILINVINNAIKYTKEGKISFTAACGEKKNGNVDIIFTVKDTGIGIRKEDLPFLFNAFRRVDEDRVNHIEGTGLGLSIVKELLELMGGKITVNSLYTKGSTFIVEIPQKISDAREVGKVGILDIGEKEEREVYQGRFEAPAAKILIVDDNTTNLMVAQKLLRDTKVQVDAVGSGKEALSKTLENEYHIILMDHLMPEMDGIECADAIRAQTGGLCKESKIVALTASASSDSKRLFEESGFDGYLTKPVSGRAIEAEVFRLLPRNLVTVTGREQDILKDTVKWLSSSQRKRPIVITTESMADLPESIFEKYQIPVISHKIRTKDGCFRDREEIDSKGLLKYMETKKTDIEVITPGVSDYEFFFADALQKADALIHITVSKDLKYSGYSQALEASESFDNVFILDSRQISSGQAFLVMEACRMAEEGMSVGEIIEKLDNMKERFYSSFIVNDLDYLRNIGQIPSLPATLLNSLLIRPVVTIRNGKMKFVKSRFGSKKNSWNRYLDSEAEKMKKADTRMLIITYSGVPHKELMYIKELIEKKVKFEQVYFVQASAAITVNCGQNAFSLLYLKQS